ncbi:MAG: ABC transporter substrate-binding protein [Desulfobacteraceae bacterium]|nr:ABC transporter substrate-binding protein [Desulfobacteraceae bacterium]
MKYHLIATTLVATVFLLLTAAMNIEASPRDQLKASIDTIIQILKDDTLTGEANIECRREALRKVFFERFDFEKTSQFSLGRHWRDRTEAERKAFVVLFSRLLEDNYVSKIESYTDEQVNFVKEQIRDKKAQIDTIIVTDTIEIPIDYRMYQTDTGQWLVYDLVIEGVSLVANYRAQFTRMLESDSFASLLKELEQKTTPDS